MIKKLVYYVWAFLTPFLFCFAAAVLDDAWLLVLAGAAVPLVLYAVPCRKQECVWGVFLLFVSLLPQNVCLFRWLLPRFGWLSSLVLVMMAISYEELLGTLLIHLMFPVQEPIKGGNE